MFVTLESVFVKIVSDVSSVIEQSETGFGDNSNPRTICCRSPRKLSECKGFPGCH